MTTMWCKWSGVAVLSVVLAACSTGPTYPPQIVDLNAPVSTKPKPVAEPVEPAVQAVQPAPAPAAVVVNETPDAQLTSPQIQTASPVSKPEQVQPPSQTLSLIQNEAQLTQAQTPVATPIERLPESDQQVVEQLLAEADKLKAAGQPKAAIMQLQRAQRIAPREPKVYARLAALHLSLGEAGRAEQMARKGLTLVAGQPQYQHFFWRIIAASRRFQGDSEGEMQALQQAQRYQ